MLTLLHFYPQNHILEDLIQGMADMQGAIGVRRTIMNDESVIGRTILLLPFIEMVGTPLYILLS